MRTAVWAIMFAVPLLAAPAAAQQGQDVAKVTFGGLKGDPELPVTVTSQTLTLDEEAGTALFEGDVLAVQGTMRLRADKMRALYDKDRERIEKIFADGNVVLVNADDAAQSEAAEYDIDSGLVTLNGNVVLTQGPATMMGDTLVADLTTGFGQMMGGVTTVFTPSAAP